MRKSDIPEASAIIEHALNALLLTVSDRGRPGSDVRVAVGSLLVRTETLLYNDTIGEPLATAFDLARDANMTIEEIVRVYNGVAAEKPVKLGGTLIKNSLLTLCCANASRLMIDIEFTSREDVDAIRLQINSIYETVKEIAADAMDSASYLELTKLHAATMNFLVETARPLPRILAFRFAAPLPTLLAAHRLYDDAGRADELRDENKVIHPLFMKPFGRALSA